MSDVRWRYKNYFYTETISTSRCGGPSRSTPNMVVEVSFWSFLSVLDTEDLRITSACVSKLYAQLLHI